MAGWHHQINGHEFEQALGDGEGQGSLACCSPWGHKELDTTEQLNNKNLSLPQEEKDWKGKEKQVKNISFFLQSWPASSLASLVLGSIVQNSHKRRKSLGKWRRARSTRLCTADRETSPAFGYTRHQELIINRDVTCEGRLWDKPMSHLERAVL